MGKGRRKITFAKVKALSPMRKLLLYIVIASFTSISSLVNAQTKVELLNADVLEYKEAVFGKVRRLIGNVSFKQEDVTMFCDSAYQNEEDNSFTAYNNVKIYQGDSVSMFGDTLFYEGNTRQALLKGEVVTLQDGQMTLTTDAIRYDAINGVGYYTTGGTIVNKENNLVSQIGTYDTKSKTFGFKQDIVLKNPEYIMYSDTLQYNTESRIAYFFGPTDIYATKDSNHVYCENGWYNTKINYSQFSINSYIETKDKKLSADSMVYTGKTGIDRAYRNILLVDTTNKIEIRGQLGEYNRKANIAWVTKAPNAAMQVEDDTLFITADTLKTSYDTAEKNRTLYTYYNTKFFKKDLQGVCDSLQYSFKDSVINMEVNPIVWSDNNQITADSIRVYMKSGGIHSIKMMLNTFIVSEKDSGDKYNQIKGKNAEAFFKDKKLKQVNVYKDVQNVYYVEEDTGKYIGMQTIICGEMKIILEKNKVSKVHYYLEPEGDMHPMDKIPAGEDKLDGFVWHENIRPLSREDVTPIYDPTKKPAPKKVTPTKQKETDEVVEVETIAPKTKDENE
jgi:lipopolysaccharide export system protein LptA